MGRTVRIARGTDVPYPSPTSAAATRIGRANTRKDTKPEIALRSELHRRGVRFRKDHFIRTADAKAHVDICFTRARVAVFVDGCFWHCCPEHLRVPKSNVDYWAPKLEANVARDRRVEAAFAAAGWLVIRIWEHEDVAGAADRIAVAVRRRLDEQ